MTEHEDEGEGIKLLSQGTDVVGRCGWLSWGSEVLKNVLCSPSPSSVCSHLQTFMEIRVLPLLQEEEHGWGKDARRERMIMMMMIMMMMVMVMV